MKKILFIMMAFMASFSAYAQEVNTNVEEEIIVVSEPILIATFNFDSEYIAENTITLIASFPTHVSEVFAVSHPCTPGNLPSQLWSFGNDTITITYPSGDLTELSRGSEGYVYIYTRNGTFIIKLIIE